MPRKYEVHHLITKFLDEQDLSRIELLKLVREELDLPVTDKTLNESLIRLLRENKISVIGYDLGIYEGVSRVQSFKPNGIVFTKVNTDPVEIEFLLKKLDSDDLEEVKSALHKLKILFQIKLDLILSQKNPDKGNELFHKIIAYRNNQVSDRKRKFTQNLAWALSDQKDSPEILKHILKFLRLK